MSHIALQLYIKPHLTTKTFTLDMSSSAAYCYLQTRKDRGVDQER